MTGIILTKDNERTIKDSVRSLIPLITELIIIDDGSTDATLDRVKAEYPEAKIVSRHLDRFDDQRNCGLEMAGTGWILMIDSDEIIEAGLKEAILAVKEEDGIDAYWAARFNRFFDTYLKEEYWNRPLLFRRSLRFKYPVHEILDLDRQRTKKIAGELRHEGWIGIEDNMDKMNRYSSLIAQKWVEQQRNYGPFKLFLLAAVLPPRYFFICFFGKKFYKAGFFNGFFYSLFESSWWLAVIFKYRELRNK